MADGADILNMSIGSLGCDFFRDFEPFAENRLGYRPRFPEEDAQRAKLRREAFNLVEAARQAQEREAAKVAAGH